MTLTADLPPRNVTPVVVGEAEDSVLLARVCAGDHAALGTLYTRHASLVFGLARRVTRDEQLARDITQDVFTYLWERPDRVDQTRGSLRTYLAVVAHRRAVDEVRRAERRARIEVDVATPEFEDGPETAVVEEAAQRWRRDRLQAALRTLSAEQRTALGLAYFDGLTYRQVAQALGLPEGTVKSRLRLALHKLRVSLGDDVRAAT